MSLSGTDLARELSLPDGLEGWVAAPSTPIELIRAAEKRAAEKKALREKLEFHHWVFIFSRLERPFQGWALIHPPQGIVVEPPSPVDLE